MNDVNAVVETPAKKIKEGNHFSPDGKWETMGRPAGLLRYKPSAIFYGRARYRGILLGPKSLETSDYDVACKILPIFIQKLKEQLDNNLAGLNAAAKAATTWSQASAEFIEESDNLIVLGTIQHAALLTRIRSAKKIASFWPSITTTPARGITPKEALGFMTEARSGTKRFTQRPRPSGVKGNQDAVFLGGPEGVGSFNHLLWTAQNIVDKAIAMDNARGLGGFDNPFRAIPRIKVPTNLPPLPSERQLEQILEEIFNNGKHKRTEEVRFRAWAGVDFLSMCGMRIGELLGEWAGTFKGDAPHPGLIWEDLHDGGDEPYIDATCEKKRKDENWRRKRKIPFFGGKDGPMAALVSELRARWYTGDPKVKVFDNIASWSGFNSFLKRACRNLKLLDDNGQPLNTVEHHLRHIFATRCVEGNVSWKALAEWLGHEDGGIIAAKTYCHLRIEHSFEMASRLGRKVPPTAPATPKNITASGKNYTADDVEKMAKRLAAMEALLKGE